MSPCVTHDGRSTGAPPRSRKTLFAAEADSLPHVAALHEYTVWLTCRASCCGAADDTGASGNRPPMSRSAGLLPFGGASPGGCGYGLSCRRGLHADEARRVPARLARPGPDG